MMSRTKTTRRAKAVIAAFVIVTGFSGAAAAQEDPLAQARELYREAVASYNDKLYDEYLRIVLELNALRPNHPRVIYMLAGAYALNGDEGAALGWLGHLADMRLVAEPAEDTDFASLAGTEAFGAMLDRFTANAAVVGRCQEAFTVPGQNDLIPEGIAYDPVSGNFYVGSVYKRAIIELRPEEARSFGSWERGDGLWSVFALRVDPVRRVLWACSSAIEQTRWVGDDEIGYAGVFQYDLSTRLVMKRFILSNERGRHLFGDMALSRTGDVYVTDGAASSIYRIGGATGVFEKWLESDRFSSPQGIAFSEDERYLFMADYSYGVFRIDARNREIRQIVFPDDLTTLGIDGLVQYDNSLVVIQNGVRPHRVMRLRLNDRQDRIESWEVLAANHPEFDEPTLGVIVPRPVPPGAQFYFVANSHWGAFDREGKLRTGARLTPPLVLKLDLP